jgi:hypothetical protein
VRHSSESWPDADIETKTSRYPNDLTDAARQRIASLSRKPAKLGCRRTFRLGRRLIGGSGGCFFCSGTIHDVVLMIDREQSGRAASPTAGVIDSQSVNAPASEKRSHDAAKRIFGRKRHIAVHTDGRLLMVDLTTADISASGRRSSCRSASVRQRCLRSPKLWTKR